MKPVVVEDDAGTAQGDEGVDGGGVEVSVPIVVGDGGGVGGVGGVGGWWGGESLC